MKHHDPGDPGTGMPAAEMWGPGRVCHLRDDEGTWLGVELVAVARWSPALLELPDPEVADLRIVAVGDSSTVPLEAARCRWLIVQSGASDLPDEIVFDDVRDAWKWSPWFRWPGPDPEAYLEAGVHAMCPPHPPCASSPYLVDTLLEYLAGRFGAPGRLVEATPEALYRLLRVYWATPDLFADAVLRERIRDDGARHLVQLTDFLDAAAVAPESEAYRALGLERSALIERLAPARYFTDAADFDRAAALALDWRDRYHAAYDQHFELVLQEAQLLLEETVVAEEALCDLERLNRTGRPIGDTAGKRLRESLAAVRRLPVAPDPLTATTSGVMLGRLPGSFAEARIAAAAVLAAVEVQRRRYLTRGRLAVSG